MRAVRYLITGGSGYIGGRLTDEESKVMKRHTIIGATMPSILAEISFLTNGQEAALVAGLHRDRARAQNCKFIR